MRKRFESDERWNDARRQIKPHVKIHHSITNHPKTAEIWQDNDFLARLVRLLMAASEKGAAHTSDVLTLRYNELPDCMGVTRTGPARDRLVTVCCQLGWQLLDNPKARTVQVTIRNFAKKQGLTPHGPRSNGADYAVLPSPLTTHTPKAPKSGGVNRSALEWFDREFLPGYPELRQTTQLTSARNFVARTLRPDEKLRSAIMSRLAAWKQSPEWTKEGGKFVPGLRNFFGNGLHEKDPPDSSGSSQRSPSGFVG